jgi:putative DNA primase/helicase
VKTVVRDEIGRNSVPLKQNEGTDSFEAVISAFRSEGRRCVRQPDGSYMVSCPGPSHRRGDQRPSLHVSEGSDTILLDCKVGCQKTDVLACVGLTMKDLFAPRRAVRAARSKPTEPSTETSLAWRTTAEYVYQDAFGTPVGKVIRNEAFDQADNRVDRSFPQQAYQEGRYVPGLRGGQLPLYGLPLVLASAGIGEKIFLVEGEKDVENLRQAREIATTNAGGTKNWRDDLADAFIGSSMVTVVADKDQPGRELARQKAVSLGRREIPFRVVEAAEGKDVSDHLAAGYTIEDLVEIDLHEIDAERNSKANLGGGDDSGLQSTESRVGTNGSVFGTTDVANAERLVRHFRDELKYVPEWKSWIVWTGQQWQPDNASSVTEYAKRVARLIHHEVAETVDPEERKLLAQWARHSESRQHLDAMVQLAKSDPAIIVRASNLNKDPMLLNCLNGTVDLRTGTLRAHDPGDLITVLATTKHDLSVPCPAWEKFLYRVCSGDSDLVSFLQRGLGYSLTGNIGERVFFMLHGPARNGKTTLLETITGILGEDYSRRMPPSLFLAKRNNGGATPDLARLQGARFAVASETEDGSRLSASIVKQLTGGDTVTARPLYSAPFEFRPEAKIWLATNHLPTASSSDQALWDRMIRIPFEARISDTELIMNLRDELLLERDGILAWLVAGCLAWQRDGLGRSPAVLNATRAYRIGMDPLAEFLDEVCVQYESAKVKMSDLRSAYEAWCTETGAESLPNNSFKAEMLDHRFGKTRKNDGTYWVGLNVK